jgi:hypothetical protein
MQNPGRKYDGTFDEFIRSATIFSPRQCNQRGSDERIEEPKKFEKRCQPDPAKIGYHTKQ